MSVIPIQDLKDELSGTTFTTAQTAELQRKLDAAEAFYARTIRPLPGAGIVRKVSASGPVVLLPPGVTAVTAATYNDGTAIAVTDLDLNADAGLLGWNYNTAGYFRPGTRNLTLTLTFGPIPLDHQQAILWDVAEAWTRTQRGGGSGRPSFGGGELEDTTPARPLTLYPRIEALAGLVIA